MHAIVHSQNYFVTKYPNQENASKVKYFFQNYEIYIGNDSDYTKNTKCAGGPFLHPDDPDSYVFDQNSYENPEA